MTRIGRWIVRIAAAALVLAAVPVQAQLVDPALLFVSAYGTVPTGGDPNILTNSGLRLTYHSESTNPGPCTTNGTVNGGNNRLCDPVLLILATPGTTKGTAPVAGAVSYSAGTATITKGGSSIYGGTWGSDGYKGTYSYLTSANGSLNAYQFIGLTAGSSSQNYTNWSSTGNTAWQIWIYKLVFTPDMGPGSYVDIAFSNLPTGTLALAYGCDGTKLNSKKVPICDSIGDTFSTPFTQTGLVSNGPPPPVPEPSVLLMLGMAAAAAAYRRRRTA